jgi:hypothetical protein
VPQSILRLLSLSLPVQSFWVGCHPHEEEWRHFSLIFSGFHCHDWLLLMLLLLFGKITGDKMPFQFASFFLYDLIDAIDFRAVVGSFSFVKIRFQSCRKLSLIGSEAAAIQEKVRRSLEFWCIFLLQICNSPLAIAVFSRHTCRRSIGCSSKNWRRGGVRD